MGRTLCLHNVRRNMGWWTEAPALLPVQPFFSWPSSLSSNKGTEGREGGGWGWGRLTLRACKAWHSTQNNRGRHSQVGRGGTHQGLRVLFLGATDTGEDDLALTPTYFLCPSGSLALGRMLAIHFKFRHMLGVSATAGATLGWQNTRESNGNEENYQSTWGKKWGNCSGNPKWPKNTFERPD